MWATAVQQAAALFFDPNVIITHARHPDIPDLAALRGKSVAVPAGTMVKERIERDYPNLHLIPTESEEEAIDLVSSGQVDMTVRSLIVAAHAIRKEGLFNLKVAGRMPELQNVLRIGVQKDEVALRNMLDKGIGTLTEVERDLAASRHAGISWGAQIDYRLIRELAVVAALLLLALLLRYRHMRRLDAMRVEHAAQQLALARRAREEQSRLVAMLSHEVKTPLAVIDCAAQSLELLVPGGSSDVATRLERIRRNVGRLESLTRQFLEKDRLEDESLRPRWLDFDLGALLEDLLAEFDQPGRVLLEGCPSTPVRGDPALLALAVRNLVHNAFKYTLPGSRVWINASVRSERVRIAVRDEGPGVPPALRDSLFRCYVRGNHGDQTPGAGLGLYLVAKVAQLHNGDVRLGAPAAGAEFILEWPTGSADAGR